MFPVEQYHQPAATAVVERNQNFDNVSSSSPQFLKSSSQALDSWFVSHPTMDNKDDDNATRRPLTVQTILDRTTGFE